MIRAFLAVDLSDDLKRVYAEHFDAARARCGALRWVRPENLHLTLKFLGDTSEACVEPLRREVEGVAAARSPVHVSVGSSGCFGAEDRPRVLWYAIDEGADDLRALARDIDAELRGLHLRSEKNPWRAHLTVARNPRRIPWHDWKAFLEAWGLCGLSFEAREVTLFSSTLGPKGPSYTSLWRAPLQGESPGWYHEGQ